MALSLDDTATSHVAKLIHAHEPALSSSDADGSNGTLVGFKVPVHLVQLQAAVVFKLVDLDGAIPAGQRHVTLVEDGKIIDPGTQTKTLDDIKPTSTNAQNADGAVSGGGYRNLL